MCRLYPVILAALGLCLVAQWGPAAEPETMSIQVREGELRAQPSFLGAIVARTEYGDRVKVLATQGAWKKVEDMKTHGAGWIHSSALSPKRIVLAAGERDAEAAASSGELALAGKGFNSDVEEKFQSRNKNVDYRWVDNMETFEVSYGEVRDFLKRGDVGPRQGGER